MKKIIIACAVLAVLGAGSVTAYMTVRNKNKQETQQESEVLADNVLFSLDSENINSITISLEDGDYTAVLDGENWELSQAPDGADFALNQTRFEGIANYIANLTAQSNYGEITDEKKAMYGLDNPYKITVSDGEKTAVLYIGDVSPTQSYYYAMADGKDNIYGISYSDASMILTDRAGLISDELTGLGDSEISGFELIKDGKTVYELTKSENGIWSFGGDCSMLTVNHSAAENIVTNVTRLTAQQVLDDGSEGMPEYFKNPYAEFIIRGYDGSEETVLVSNDTDKLDKEYVSVYIENSGLTESYYTGDFKYTDYTVDDLIPTTFECAGLYSLSGFSFVNGDISDSFTLDQSTGKVSFGGNEIDLNNAEMYSFFSAFYNSIAYLNITGTDTEVSPVNENPLFTAVYQFDDDTPEKTVELVGTGTENECYLFVDGVYTGFIVDGGFMKENYYETLCTHAGIE